MWEMAQRGIGSAKGLMLIEKEDDHVCGIIEPICYIESSGLGQSPFSPSYNPYCMTTHAMRINIATQIQMRYVGPIKHLHSYGITCVSVFSAPADITASSIAQVLGARAEFDSLLHPFGHGIPTFFDSVPVAQASKSSPTLNFLTLCQHVSFARMGTVTNCTSPTPSATLTMDRPIS